MQIVHAVPFFDPATRFGGPVVQLRRLCRLLAERGHEVSVVTTDVGVEEDLPRDRWLQRDGYRVVYARAGRLGTVAPYVVPGVRRPLAEALDGADVVHLALSFAHINVVAHRLARRGGVPLIYTAQGCLAPPRLRAKRIRKLAYLALFERRIIRDAAAVQVLTDEERAQAIRQGARPGQCVVVPNAAELDPDDDLPEAALFRRHAGIDDEAPLVLFMGRLQRIKGLGILLEAFAGARGGSPAAQLVIAGPDEGEQRRVEAHAERLGIRDAVHLVGQLDGQLRLAALAAADVFCLTSFAEGMPNAVLEACAAGTPALITEGCNLPEVERCGAGRVVPAEVAAAATALGAMLRDPGRLKLMGEAARRMIRERFTFPVIVERVERMYEQVVLRSATGSARHGSAATTA